MMRFGRFQTWLTTMSCYVENEQKLKKRLNAIRAEFVKGGQDNGRVTYSGSAVPQI